MEKLNNMFNELLRNTKNANIKKFKKTEVELKIHQNKIQQNYIANMLNSIFEIDKGNIWKRPNYKDNNKIIFSTNFGKSKWGLIDLNTKKVSKTIYNVCYIINNIIIVEDTDIYRDDEYSFFYECYSYGILDLKDQEIIILNNENNIKKGLIVLNEKIDFKYSNYKYYSKGNFIAIKDKKTNKYSFINTHNKETIQCEYDNCCWDFLENFAIVRKDNKFGFINKEGKEIIPLIYDYCSDFLEGLARVRKDDKYGFINTKGEEVIPLIYDDCWNFKNGLAIVNKNNKYGFVNKQGKEIIPCKYDFCFSFSEGLAVVSKNDKWGFVNKEGKEVIPLIYNSCNDFSEGLAFVFKNNKCGFINKKGKEIIPLKYDYCTVFENGLAIINKDNKFGFIDKTGQEYWFNKSDCFEEVGSRYDNLYYLKYKDTFIIKTGCFLGKLEEFEKAVKKTHGNNRFAQQYFEIINFLKSLNDNMDKQ